MTIAKRESILCNPLLAQIEISESCNYSCGYCYNYWRKKGGSDTLTPKQVIEIIARLATLNILAVAFTGGEPCLYKDALNAGIKAASKRGILVSLNTNASLLDNNEIDNYIKNHIYFLISLPSYKKTTYRLITTSRSYDNVIQNIRLIVSTGGMVTINMVVNDLNVKQIRDTGRFVKEELGISNFRATPVSPPQYLTSNKNSIFHLSLSNYPEYFKQIRILKDEYMISTGTLGTIPFCFIPNSCYDIYSLFLGCTAGRGIITIGANGNIRPCSQADFNIGNLFSFPKKEFIAELRHRLEPWRRGRYLPAECKECIELYRCNGGCRMHAFNIFGSLKAKDPRMKEQFKDALFILKKKTTPSLYQCGIGGNTYKAKEHIRFRRERKGFWTIFSGDYYDLVNTETMALFRHFFLEGHTLPSKINKRLSSLVSYFLARNYVKQVK